MNAMTLTEWAAWLAGRGVSRHLNPPAELGELYLRAYGSEGGFLLGMPLFTLAQLSDEYAAWEHLIYGSGGRLENSELKIDSDGSWSTPNGYVALNAFRPAGRGAL